MGPLFSHAKWTCELAIKWTQRQKSTGKSPLFSRSTVHGPRPHFIDTLEVVNALLTGDPATHTQPVTRTSLIILTQIKMNLS